MEIEDRIVIDTEEIIEKRLGEIEAVERFGQRETVHELFKPEFLEKLDRWVQTIRRQKDMPLTVTVCGEFKRGKSSLINAVFGEDIVTTNVNTETITVNKLSYGEHENVLVLSGGKKMFLSDDELKCDNLKKILSDLPAKPLYLSLKRPLEVLKNVNLVDTPGLDDSLHDYAEEVGEALRQSDAIIYVFSVAYPISMGEQFFIKSSLRGKSYTELFFIGNFTDTLETVENSDRMKDVIKRRTRELLPGIEPVMLSSLDERCRQMEVKRPSEEMSDMLGANFDAFRRDLFNLLEMKKDSIIPDRIERLAGLMAEDLGADLMIMKEALESDLSEAEQRLQNASKQRSTILKKKEEMQERIVSFSRILRGEAIGWLEELVDKMEADVPNLKKESVEDIKKYYSVFCIETLQEAISLSSDHAMTRLYEEMEKLSQEISKELSFAMPGERAAIRMDLTNNTWTDADTTAYISQTINSLLGGIFFIPSLVINFFSGVARDKKIQESIDDMLEEIKKQYPKLKKDALEMMDKSYLDLVDQAKRQISDFFDLKIEENEKQAALYEAAARQDEEGRKKMGQLIEEIQKILAGMKAE